MVKKIALICSYYSLYLYIISNTQTFRNRIKYNLNKLKDVTIF